MKDFPYTESKDTRSGFGAGLHELGKTKPNVVALCAGIAVQHGEPGARRDVDLQRESNRFSCRER